jgi:uncharacterized membrane protein
MLAALIAYTALVVGWMVFATNLTKQLVSNFRWNPLLAGFVAGLLYGFVVYGVFNGTLHVMFDNYGTTVSIRDLLWGMFWASTLTTIYAGVTYGTSKK